MCRIKATLLAIADLAEDHPSVMLGIALILSITSLIVAVLA